MSRGSPRRSFSPIRPMSQSYGDRRRSNSYILHPHDRSYVPNEGTRNTESQNFRSTREENVPQRPHSPIDLRRMRLPVPALPYRDRPLTPGPMISFGDRDVTPGIAAPPFRDIAVTSEVVTSSGAAAFQENSSASYMSDDRPLGNDHWSPPAQTTASSVAWDHKVPWSDHRSWPSRSNVSPLYTSNRPLVNSTQRPLLEPSQAWRRAREERDRQLSIEYRTIIPSDRRNSPTDNCVGDNSQDIERAPIAVPMNSMQHTYDMQDFQSPRFRQQPPPSPLLPQYEQRVRYSDRSLTSDSLHRAQTNNSKRSSAYISPRRPLHRVSARISARPKRSPSPTSASSDTSASGPTRSQRRNRSESRSSRSRFSSQERASRPDFNSRSVAYNRPPSSPRRRSSRHSRSARPLTSSPTHAAPGRLIAPTSHAQTVPLSASVAASACRRTNSITSPTNFRSHPPSMPESMRQRNRVTPSRRSHSLTSHSSQSSIRSSVHSSPDLMTTEISPDPHINHSPPTGMSPPDPSKFTVTSETTLPFPPPDDTEFELPGMRFQRDGALKPGLSPPSPKSGIDIQIGLSIAELPPRTDTLAFGIIDDSTTSEADAQDQVIVTSIHDAEEQPDIPFSDSTASSSPAPDLPAICDTDVNGSSSLHLHVKDDKGSRGHPGNLTTHAVSQAPHMKQSVPFIERQETSQLEVTEMIDPGAIAPDSSPLTEPMPLSPPPDLPGLQEDLDGDGSSMEIENESASEAADDIAAALRVFAKAREGKDFQTRSERYEPILRANHSLLDAPCTRITTSSDEVVHAMMKGSFQARIETHSAVAESLLERFKRRTEDMSTKTRRLRAEYKTYHDRWVANCRNLDQSMASSASQGVEGLPPPSGRVTRRSTNLGDAVRSDLEMEQIIASLGNEDLTDPNVLAIRNTAVIPDLISTDPSALNVTYKDDNGLVDDPEDMFNVYDALGRWTDEEKELYLEKYGIYPKQFGLIASFIPGKTSAQCVMFYYLHKKELIDFRAAIAKYGPKRKRRGGRKTGKGKGNALLADIIKPPRAQVDEESTTHKHSDRFRDIPKFDGRFIPSRRPVRLLQENERGFSRVNTGSNLAQGNRIVALQLEQDTVGSDADSTHSSRPRQSPHLRMKSARPSPSEDGEETGTVVVATVEDRRKRQARIAQSQEQDKRLLQEPSHTTKPPEKGKEKEKRPPGRPPKKSKLRALGKEGLQKSTTSYVWTKGEEANYLELLRQHGRDFAKIAAEMPAKTLIQCRNYYRNHAKDRDLERIANEAEKAEVNDTSQTDEAKVIPQPDMPHKIDFGQ